MANVLKAADLLLKRACHRTYGEFSPMHSNGQIAFSILLSETPDPFSDIDGQAKRFINTLRILDDRRLDTEIDAALTASIAPELQSDSSTVLTIGSSLALVIFALRFTEITVSGKSVRVRANDTKYTSDNFRLLFDFLARLLSSMQPASSGRSTDEDDEQEP